MTKYCETQRLWIFPVVVFVLIFSSKSNSFSFVRSRSLVFLGSFTLILAAADHLSDTILLLMTSFPKEIPKYDGPGMFLSCKPGRGVCCRKRKKSMDFWATVRQSSRTIRTSIVQTRYGGRCVNKFILYHHIFS